MKERVKEVFAQALEKKSPAEREQYLAGACAGDDALLQEVESLLLAHDRAGGFLQPQAPDEAAQATMRIAPPVEVIGARIGRYKLLQQIGEGGCGVVYMAEQEEPVRRRVALKVIKLGMDTRSVIARFEAERQALALMDHPNIAKVLDAGATETGRPYFVMELVRGVKITDYCDENSLPMRERLDLFMQVCRAIQHAHQKGVIHRDIKPSNILVTMNDGVPVPKVIDFGIAKATEGKLTDKTLFTAFEQFIGTPAYMSPEQAEMSALDIDTRSDIYSLGVLLYELLTGQTPFDAKKLFQAGLDEIRRTIRHQEPARPSTRLSTMLDADLTLIAKQRRVEPPGLIHLVRGDLDWIVMKALEKDRTRRYETANGLAMDIQRHLSNEPVAACPPSNLYRLQKVVRRNKLAFAATAVVALALVGGLGLATYGLLKARSERDRASEEKRLADQARQTAEQERETAEQARQTADEAREAADRARQQAEADKHTAQTEANKSRQVAQFLTDMLQSVSPSVAKGRDTTLLRDILDSTAARVGKDLSDQPEVEVELYDTLGSVYLDLGDPVKGEAMYRQEVALWRKLPADMEITPGPLLRLGASLFDQGKFEEAEALQREALAMFKKVNGTNNGLRASYALSDLSGSLLSEGKLAEAESTEREALAIRRAMMGNENWDVANAIWGLGRVFRVEHKLAEAESNFREAASVFRKLEENHRLDLVYCLNDLALALADQDRTPEAVSVQREAVDIERKCYDQAHPRLASSIGSLAALLQREGKLAEAESFYREALAIQTKLYGSEGPSSIGWLSGLAGALDAQGRFAEAEVVLRQDLAIQRKLPGKEDDVISIINWLSGVLAKEGKSAEADLLIHEKLEEPPVPVATPSPPK